MGRASRTASRRFGLSGATILASAMAICPATAVRTPSHLRLAYPFPRTGEGCAPMDETRRLTYGELAAARGVTVATARRMAPRYKWPKQVGNDGLARVAVPVAALRAMDRPDAPGAIAAPEAVAALEAVIGALREE